MDQVLTMEEIEARYAPDWVLIGDLETNESHEVLSGKVLLHGPDRDELYRKAKEFPPGRFAVRFLGTWPEDRVLIKRFWVGWPNSLDEESLENP